MPFFAGHSPIADDEEYSEGEEDCDDSSHNKRNKPQRTGTVRLATIVDKETNTEAALGGRTHNEHTHKHHHHHHHHRHGYHQHHYVNDSVSEAVSGASTKGVIRRSQTFTPTAFKQAEEEDSKQCTVS